MFDSDDTNMFGIRCVNRSRRSSRDKTDTISLKSLRYEGEAEGVLFTYKITQTYRNDGKTTREISYSFPLALNTAVTEFAAVINGERLVARPLKRKAAQKKYEQAMEKGDQPLLLECSDPNLGVMTANIGTLKPGEEVSLEICCATILSWCQGSVAITIPTAIGERYGSAAAQGRLQPHEQVIHSLTAEYEASARVTLKGELAKGQVLVENGRCSCDGKDGTLTVEIPHADASRDLNLRLTEVPPFDYAVCARGLIDKDYTALVASTGPLPEIARRPLRLRLLIDCSGSMAGMAISRVRQALAALVDELQEGDRLSLSLFGGICVHRIGTLRACSERFLKEEFIPAVSQIEADMGGTEMLQAFTSICALDQDQETPADILLLTDGEIWEVEPILKTARDSGSRVFVLGIGMTPAGAVLGKLAELTGGRAEITMPAEDMGSIVSRMVQCMRGDRITRSCRFGGRKAALKLPCFSGCSGHTLQNVPSSDATVSIDGNSGLKLRLIEEGSPLMPRGTLEKLRAQEQMRLLGDSQDKAERMAEKYGILGPHVSMLMVNERSGADKVEGMPEVERVPQMRSLGVTRYLEACHVRHSRLAPALSSCLVETSPMRFEDMHRVSFDDHIDEGINVRSAPSNLKTDVTDEDRKLIARLRDELAVLGISGALQAGGITKLRDTLSEDEIMVLAALLLKPGFTTAQRKTLVLEFLALLLEDLPETRIAHWVRKAHAIRAKKHLSGLADEFKALQPDDIRNILKFLKSKDDVTEDSKLHECDNDSPGSNKTPASAPAVSKRKPLGDFITATLRKIMKEQN